MNAINSSLTHSLCLCLGLFSIGIMGQVGINTTTPHASSVLHVESANKGILVPRISLDNPSTAAPVTSPAEGLLVYNNGGAATDGFYFWNGSAWILLSTGVGAPPDNLGNHTATQNINLNGNNISNNGTTAGITINNTGKVTLENELAISTIPAGNITTGTLDQIVTVDGTGNVRKVPASALSSGGSGNFVVQNVSGSSNTINDDTTHIIYADGSVVSLPDPASNAGDLLFMVLGGAIGGSTVSFTGNIPQRGGSPETSITARLIFLQSNGSVWTMQVV